MAKLKSITQSQNRDTATKFIDLIGESKSGFEVVKFSALADTLAYVAAVYADKLTKQLVAKDADSSGALADSIIPLDVVIFGNVYSVSIEAKKYAKFIDEGVNGWAQSRGSQYSFKKGTRKRGEAFTGKSAMVDSLKTWLVNESKISRLTKKITVSDREKMRAAIKDTSLQGAITAAYMIKRFGIKPTHFWQDATKEMDAVIKKEFSAALKVDIIDNLKV